MVATAFLVFYRFKTMSKEEAEKAKGQWENLRNGVGDVVVFETSVYLLHSTSFYLDYLFVLPF
jgi:hypothetical protein